MRLPICVSVYPEVSCFFVCFFVFKLPCSFGRSLSCEADWGCECALCVHGKFRNHLRQQSRWVARGSLGGGGAGWNRKVHASLPGPELCVGVGR